MPLRGSGVILVTSLIFCVFIYHVGFGSRVTHNKLEARQRVIKRDCTTALAPDLYGLGVRMGVYFQWFSAWIGNSFLVDEIAGGLDANAMYLSAILIAMYHSTVYEEKMTLMDGLILMWLCAGTTGSVLSLWGYRTCAYRKEKLPAIARFGGFGTHLRIALTTVVAGYAVWYWKFAARRDGDNFMLPFGVIGQDVNENCTDPEVKIFGQKVQDDLARYTGVTFSIIHCIYCLSQLIAAPIAPVTRIWKMCILWKKKAWASSTRLRFATGASEKQLKTASYFLSGLTFCWMSFSAVAIERILNENCAWSVLVNGTSRNGNILTPGQLLPTVIGAFSFVRVLYLAFEKWRDPSENTSPSLGREKSRRGVRAKRDSRHGWNAFKMFSLSNAEDADQFKPKIDTAAGEDLLAFQKMNVFVRVMITIVPHISLFWSWPWVRRDEPWPEYEEIPINTPRQDTDDSEHFAKKRSVTWSDKDVSVQLEDKGVYDSPVDDEKRFPRDFA